GFHRFKFEFHSFFAETFSTASVTTGKAESEQKICASPPKADICLLMSTRPHTQLPDDPADALTVLRYARELVEWECEAGFGSHEKIASLTHGDPATRAAAMLASLLAG